MRAFALFLVSFFAMQAWGVQRKVIVHQEAPSEKHLDWVSENSQIYFKACDEITCREVTQPMPADELKEFLAYYHDKLTEIEVQRAHPNRFWENTLNQTSLPVELSKFYLTGAGVYVLGSLVEQRFKYPYVLRNASGATYLASLAGMIAWGIYKSRLAERDGYLALHAGSALYFAEGEAPQPMFLDEAGFDFLTKTLKTANKLYFSRATQAQ